MKGWKLPKRCAVLLLALAFLFTDMAANPQILQAASKQVKSVSLKIGSKNVTKKTVTMYSGESKTLKASVSPKSAKKKVTFTSSKKSVATVSSKGVITAKKSGTAQIKVTVTGKNNKKKSTYVKVKVKYVSLSLNKKTANLKAGEKLNLTARVSPKKKVKWSSSNRKVATVSSKGVVKGVKAGTAKVTASVGSKKASCMVKVTGAGSGNGGNTSTNVKVQGVNASIEGGNTVYVGHSSSIITQIIPANATDQTLSYSSSNRNIAQVTERGVILGISEGAATITITAAGNVSTALSVKVVEVPVESVKVTPEKVVLPITGTTNLSAQILPAEASKKLVNWSSDNMSIARVDANGKVTGVSGGTTQIKAQVAGSSQFGLCTVEVDPNFVADGLSMQVINPYKDNVGNVYENTMLFGRDMTLRVRLMRDKQPVGKSNINLQLKAVSGNGEDCFEVRQANKETDSDGYADFHIGVKNNDWNAVSGKWQSFIAIARDSASNKTAELSIRFASVHLERIEVVSDIIPSRNASFADSGIYETVSTNGSKKVEYVTSQQVSSPSEDHSVSLEAQPYLLLPATKETTDSGEWHVSFPNEDGNGISGNYSIYNDDTNETTTTTVEEVPAGLNSLSVKFDKIALSKYTAIYMDLYSAETGKLMDHQELTAVNNGAAAAFSFGKQTDERGYLVVSLVSQGQVEEGCEGYVIREIAGAWESEKNEKAEAVKLENAVKWEILSPEFIVANDLPNVEEYIPESMIADNYTYRYRIPNFPQVGNAIIEATGPNNDGVKEYFVYPSVNVKTGETYDNRNSLAPVRRAVKAVYLGKDDVTHQVGRLRQDGNKAIVDSTETGLTTIRAKIAVEGLEKEELNSQNGGTLYSSIQWVPVPNKIPSEIVSDYYALEGQSVTITAQVIDEVGNPVAAEGIITFQYDNGSGLTDITTQGQTLPGPGNDTTTNYVTVSEITNGTTNTTGQAVLKLRGVNAGYVEGITAVCQDYNVKLTIGSEGTEEIKKANIYWVDMGLTYVNSAVREDSPERTTNFACEVASIPAVSSSLVGKTWKIGFLPVAQSYKFNYTDPAAVERPSGENEFIGVSGISISYSRDGVGGCSQQDNTAVLSSTQTGTTYLTGIIKLPSDSSNVKFTFYDEDGNEVTHTNIGDSISESTASDTGLKYQMDWEPSGENLEILEGEKKSFPNNEEVQIHVKLSDDYGNPIRGANISYTVSGYHKDMGTQNAVTNDSGIVAITLSAPNEAGVSSTISVTAERDKDLQGSIIVSYTN